MIPPSQRWGKRITARGIYREERTSLVIATLSKPVDCAGARLMLLVNIPWAHRVWALPFFTVLTPSERYHQSRRHQHKTLTDWARQMLTQVRLWLP